MKLKQTHLQGGAWAGALGLVILLNAQSPGTPERSTGSSPAAAGASAPGGPGFDGPPPFGGPPGGPGGFMQQETKLVKQFDRDGDGRLNTEERKAARESVKQQRSNRGSGGPWGRPGGFGGGGENESPARPGARLTQADVKTFGDAPVYDLPALRTFFLQFEAADWEKELADFNNTDVEVPATLTVDGRSYPDIGVHFRGMTSFMMVGEGHKRPLNLSLDFVHKDQNLGGYRTFNLLNAHEDPTFLRTVLYYHIAREYVPAPKANFVRLVINGESWGVYINAQQFNKEFVRDVFGTTKGARWKVQGSPGGRGGLQYLGDEAEPYRRIYNLKSKEDPKSWGDLIELCRILNETPVDQLEAALTPRLDIDGALKFLALDNAFVNNDGFWTRASDYTLYEDVEGRFHFIPHDANETFSAGGGPGGPGGFGPGMFLAPAMFGQADRNGDQKLERDEWVALAGGWFGKLDAGKTGKITQEQFTANLGQILPPPPGMSGPGAANPGVPAGTAASGPRGPGGQGGFDPSRFMGPPLFAALDVDKDGSLTQAELEEVFGHWFSAWGGGKDRALGLDKIRDGINGVVPQSGFGGRRSPGGPDSRRGPGGPGGPGGGGFRGGPGGGGVDLDPLVAANDASKPLCSKLLAVPALRARYLRYVKELAVTWLDWSKLGPLAEQYQAVIAADVENDTRKLYSNEAFLAGLTRTSTPEAGTPGGRPANTLRDFAEKRRAFLLSRPEIKQAGD